MPITWRNVDSDTTRGAAALMEVSRRAFNDGLGNLQQAVQQVNQNRADNWATQRQVNTDAFLDRLAQFSTPEQLAAAQQSGELAALRQQFGGQIDRDAIRNAEATQNDILMKRVAAANQYADDKQARDQRPLVNDFFGLLSAGKTKEAQALLDNTDFGAQEAGLTEKLTGRNDKLFSQGLQKDQLAISRGHLGLAQAADARQQAEFNDRREELFSKRAAIDLGDQALQGAPDFATARTNYLAMAKKQGLRDDVVNAGLQNLQQSYTTRTGLTPEQDAIISANPDVLAYSKQSQMDKEMLERNRYNKVENFQTTVDDAIAKVFPRVKGEEDDTARAIRKELDTFLANRESAKKINMGPVLAQALESAGIDEKWGDDTLDLSKFQDKLKNAYDEYNQYDVLKQKAQDSATTAAALRLKKQLELIQGNIANNLK